MNERIQELAEQAGLIAGTNDNLDFKKELTVSEKKFAELLLQECLQLCEQVAVDADKTAKGAFVTDAGRMLHEGMWGGAKNCSGRIKNYFGVEG